jgi:hypothetical protein
MIREIASRAAKWLAQPAPARLPALRAGDAQSGADLGARQAALPDGNIEFVFGGGLRMVVTPDDAQDVRVLLVENGDVRDELSPRPTSASRRGR